MYKPESVGVESGVVPLVIVVGGSVVGGSVVGGSVVGDSVVGGSVVGGSVVGGSVVGDSVVGGSVVGSVKFIGHPVGNKAGGCYSSDTRLC